MPKAQHSPAYRRLLPLWRKLREDADMTQRDLGAKLRKPQLIHNCETGSRRIDVTEFASWCKACGANPRQHSIACSPTDDHIRRHRFIRW